MRIVQMAESVVGPWARDKLDRLAKYLNAYTLIMKDQKWCKGYHYVDAFAGPGEHEIRGKPEGQRHAAKQALLDVSSFGSRQDEQQQFLAGSPRVALELRFPFSNYIFVEHSPERIKSLERLKSEYGVSRQIHIRQEDCTKYLLDKIAANPKLDWKVNRALVFLDPFGMQVGWRTIEALASTKAIEIFLNFPVGMAIQRLLLRQPAKFTDVQRRRLDDYFGSPDWMTILYKRNAIQPFQAHDSFAQKSLWEGSLTPMRVRKRQQLVMEGKIGVGDASHRSFLCKAGG